jgi:hypothetical protein
MLPFLEFIELIDKDRPDFYKQLRGTPKKKKDHTSSTTSLNDEEQAFLEKETTKYRIQLKNERWQKVLQTNLKYKKPAIINLDPADLNNPERLYVLPIFIKSGK